MLALAQSHLTDARRLAMAHTANEGIPATPGAFVRVGFTSRESEVLYWLVQGKANHEIADELHVRSETVSGVLHAIYEKMGVGDRVSATVGALALIRRIVLPAPFRKVAARGDPSSSE